LFSDFLLICSVHDGGETDTLLDQSSTINTKMSAVEWLVYTKIYFYHYTLQ